MNGKIQINELYMKFSYIIASKHFLNIPRKNKIISQKTKNDNLSPSFTKENR